MQWGDRWCARDGKPPIALVEEATGKPVERLTVHAEGGRPLSFGQVRFAPGPGASAATQAVVESRNRKVLGRL